MGDTAACGGQSSDEVTEVDRTVPANQYLLNGQVRSKTVRRYQWSMGHERLVLEGQCSSCQPQTSHPKSHRIFYELPISIPVIALVLLACAIGNVQRTRRVRMEPCRRAPNSCGLRSARNANWRQRMSAIGLPGSSTILWPNRCR